MDTTVADVLAAGSATLSASRPEFGAFVKMNRELFDKWCLHGDIGDFMANPEAAAEYVATIIAAKDSAAQLVLAGWLESEDTVALPTFAVGAPVGELSDRLLAIGRMYCEWYGSQEPRMRSVAQRKLARAHLGRLDACLNLYSVLGGALLSEDS